MADDGPPALRVGQLLRSNFEQTTSEPLGTPSTITLVTHLSWDRREQVCCVAENTFIFECIRIHAYL